VLGFIIFKINERRHSRIFSKKGINFYGRLGYGICKCILKLQRSLRMATCDAAKYKN